MENQRNDKSEFGRTDTGSSAYGSGPTGASGRGPTQTSSDKAGSAGAVREVAEELGSKAEKAVNRAAASIGDQFSSTVDYFRKNGVEELMDDVTGYVKAHPAQALIGAAVLGFVAGRMARRS